MFGVDLDRLHKPQALSSSSFVLHFPLRTDNEGQYDLEEQLVADQDLHLEGAGFKGRLTSETSSRSTTTSSILRSASSCRRSWYLCCGGRGAFF